MRTVIMYDSVKGFTKECAEFLSNQLTDAVVVPLQEVTEEHLQYKEIYIGTHIIKKALSIHTQRFLKTYHKVLLNKTIKMFISALDKSDYNNALQESMHPEMYYRTKKVRCGGRIRIKELSFFERRTVKKYLDIDKDVELFYQDSLLELIQED